MIRTIHVLPALKDNFIFMLEHDSGFVCIDPGETTPVLQFLEHRAHSHLTDILCTHHHADHINGMPFLKPHFECQVWCSAFDRSRIRAATHSAITKFQVGGDQVETISTPGHTLGQVAYHFPRLEAVFVGDTLFSAGCGRLFEGTPEIMFESLQRLKNLPPRTQIYFGHEYTLRNLQFVEAHGLVDLNKLSEYRKRCEEKLERREHTVPVTLEDELQINPFLRAKDVAEFARIRQLRDNWT